MEEEAIGELAQILATAFERLQKIRRISEGPESSPENGLALGAEQSVHVDVG